MSEKEFSRDETLKKKRSRRVQSEARVSGKPYHTDKRKKLMIGKRRQPNDVLSFASTELRAT